MPPHPGVSLTIPNDTINPGEGIDVVVEWTRDSVPYPILPDTFDISIYRTPDGMLLETYTIPKVVEGDDGRTRRFAGTIPASILPSGEVTVVAADPVYSAAESRISLRILASGEDYQEYRDRQLLESYFYPAATGLIIVLLGALAILIAKKE